jgi:hypothetical protein
MRAIAVTVILTLGGLVGYLGMVMNVRHTTTRQQSHAHHTVPVEETHQRIKDAMLARFPCHKAGQGQACWAVQKNGKHMNVGSISLDVLLPYMGALLTGAEQKVFMVRVNYYQAALTWLSPIPCIPAPTR